MAYELLISRTFQNQLLRVPARELPKVMARIDRLDRLREAPQVDGKDKKRLVNYKGSIYRIRSGDYRILYTFGDAWVKLLGIDLRRDAYHRNQLVDTASPQFDVKEVPTLDDLVLAEDVPIEVPSSQPLDTEMEYRSTGPEPPVRNLAAPLGGEISTLLLQRLHVDQEFHDELRACKTDVDLINANIPSSVRDRVFDIVTAPDYDQVLEQPSSVVESLEDLERFYDGDLISFAIKLDAKQERIVKSLAGGHGPYVIKGPPGAGKTTVLMHALAMFQKEFERERGRQPRILFATYTQVLKASAKQLLGALCGERTKHIEIETLDSKALAIVGKSAGHVEWFEDDELLSVFKAAVDSVESASSISDGRYVSLLSGSRMTWDYLIEEIEDVIVGRNVQSQQDYLDLSRDGRQKRLGARQRSTVWEIGDRVTEELARRNRWTWPRIRRHALELIQSRPELSRHYDAVFVDEAQDLQPNSFHLVLELGRQGVAGWSTTFIAADRNQSIYGSGYSIPKVSSHGESLLWHVYPLPTNHRSTAQILDGASRYLSGSELDEDKIIPNHLHKGPLPIVSFQTQASELDRIVKFFVTTTKELRQGFEMCALLCATNNQGEAFAEALRKRGLPAKYMTRSRFDYRFEGIKVLTRHSVKGLEFPAVALSLVTQRDFKTSDYEESGEFQGREHRLNHMCMTRAMRSLLVTLPIESQGDRYTSIQPPEWIMEMYGTDECE